jgi:hypothetical protein
MANGPAHSFSGSSEPATPIEVNWQAHLDERIFVFEKKSVLS